jgi:hypothetical protein
VRQRERDLGGGDARKPGEHLSRTGRGFAQLVDRTAEAGKGQRVAFGES